MSVRKRLAAVVMATGVAFVPMLATTAGTAHADRCQPEELVFGAGSSPIDERDHPGCVVLINYVYPLVCDNFTTLATCMQSISPNPGYRPGLVLYQPDPNRVYCGLYTYAVPGGTCARTSDGPVPAPAAP